MVQGSGKVGACPWRRLVSGLPACGFRIASSCGFRVASPLWLAGEPNRMQDLVALPYPTALALRRRQAACRQEEAEDLLSIPRPITRSQRAVRPCSFRSCLLFLRPGLSSTPLTCSSRDSTCALPFRRICFRLSHPWPTPLQSSLLSLERSWVHVPKSAAAAHGGVRLPLTVRAGHGPGDPC